MLKPDIKIFVVCHKPTFVPENQYLYPIQVGTELAERKLHGMKYYDNEGDHISDKNKSYCELTAHYYAWKNVEADYYGFFHYRRYFSFNPELVRDDGWGNIDYDKLNDAVAEELCLNEKDMSRIITKYDMITVKGRKYPDEDTTIYSEYGVAPFQNKEDLDVTLEVLYKLYPQYQAIAKAYLQSNVAHECNMFIMSKALFHEYCEWIFSILFEVEKCIDTTWYSEQEYRIFGYLAERLTGIFYKYVQSNVNYKTHELRKTLFRDTTPKVKLAQVFDNNAVPIVLAANNKFSPYLDVMIRSIVANATEQNNYDIIVLHSDIQERNMDRIKTAAEDCANISIRFAKVDEYFAIEDFFVDQHLSIETYYRLIIPEIMPTYGKILYLDCDMVVDDDVAKLYAMNLNGHMIGAAKDIDVAGQVRLNINNWSKYACRKLKLDQPYDYFQAGVLILDLDKIREKTSSKKMIELAIKNDFRCHDQDVMNIVARNDVKYIPQVWNTLMCWEEPDGRGRRKILEMAPRGLYQEYCQARKKPSIIHFAGYQKPWQVGDCDFAEYFWKYARTSPYYEMLIRNVWDFRLFKENIILPIVKKKKTLVDRPGAVKVARFFFPLESKRGIAVRKLYVRFVESNR